MRQAGGAILLVIGVALCGVSLVAYSDAATIPILDETLGGAVRWAVGVAGLALLAFGWSIVSGRPL